jgi:hypothetical protein
MAETTTTPTPGTTTDILGVVAELLRTGTDPDILQAQKILMRRTALQGDIAQSRLPAPLNITEIGGYINLLANLQQPELSSQMLAGILGVAGPNPPLGWLDTGPALKFMSIPNDRPEGPAQPSIPTMISIRSDMVDALLAARKQLHDVGCTLPLLTPIRALPPAMPGYIVPEDLLPFLGRTMQIVPAAVLGDPATDPIALARLATDPPGTFQLVARELDGGTLVTEQTWAALQCDNTTCTLQPGALARYQPIMPILNSAGWYNPQPPVVPTDRIHQGNQVQFINITGLIVGVTRLVDELTLLYPQAQIMTSALSTQLSWVWDGSKFTAPT